jgi:hypothetical protein
MATKGKGSKSVPLKVLEHVDKDEILSKLIIGISPADIHEWLASKYTNISESQFVISEKALKSFQENYLDIYNMVKADLGKTQSALALGVEDQLQLSLQNNSAYKSVMLAHASNELDIKTILLNAIYAIEARTMQIFDLIQNDPSIVNTREERLHLEYFDRLGALLEKYSKYVLGAPDQVIQHQVTVQHIDQHVAILQDAIRETLAELDQESSLRFMDIFTEKMAKFKPPTEVEIKTDQKLADVKVISEKIQDLLDEDELIT